MTSFDRASESPARRGALANVWIVAITYVRFALRTGAGIVFVFLFFTGMIGLAGTMTRIVLGFLDFQTDMSEGEKMDALYPIFVKMLTQFDRLASDEFPKEALQMPDPMFMLANMSEAKTPETWYLTVTNPGLISMIYVLLLWVIPLTACLVGFSQTAIDAGNRGLRFLLLRTERFHVYFGRFLGTVIYVSISMFGCMIIICAYFHFGLDAYEAVDVWRWGIQCTLATFLLVIPYLAICAWVSGASNGGFISLILCFAVCFGSVFIIMTLVGTVRAKLGLDLSEMLRLFPIGWKDDLLSVHLGRRLVAYGMMLVFTAVYLSLGYRQFNRRDL